MPRIVDYMPTRRFTTVLLFIAANAFYAFSTAFIVFGAIVYCAHCIGLLMNCKEGTDIACIVDRGGFYLVLTTVSVLGAFALTPAIASVIAGLARRAVRISTHELLKRDERRPILLLRPFRDDQVGLKQADVNFLARVGQWRSSITTLDELILDEGTPYGPVVAIGNPNDRFPPYGAARGYFDDRTWQEAVTDLAERAMAIVICVDDFEGIWWEVESVVSRHFDKTLLLLPPKYASQAANEEIRHKLILRLSSSPAASQLAEALQDMLPTGGGQAVLAMFTSTSGRIDLAVSSTFSQLAYLIAVRRFLRTKWGLATPLHLSADR